MKEIKERSNNLKNWGLSILTNTVIMAAIMITTKMTYETNDDYAISIRIAGGYPYVGFVNYYLCRVLIVVQSFVKDYNVYVIFLIAISFLSFAYFTKIILGKSKQIPVRLILLGFLIVFSFDHYCAIQFTKTAALVLTVGFVSLTDSIKEKRGISAYIIAFIIVYIGIAVRYEFFFIALAISSISAIVWIVGGGKNFQYKISIKKAASSTLIILLIGSGVGWHNLSDKQNTSTPELQYASEYNLYRSNIVDFPTYDYYDQNKEHYDKIGISKNDLFLINKWVFDYDGAASFENLEKIDGIERPKIDMSAQAKKSVKRSIKYIINGFINLSSNGLHIMLLIAIACTMLLTLKKRHLLYVMAIGGAAFGIYIALYYIQRVNYRSLYIADIGAAIWLIYYLSAHADYEMNTRRNRLAMLLGVALLTMSTLFILPLSHNCQNKSDRSSKAVMSVDAEKYFKAHGNKVFVWATGEKKYARRYLTPLLVPNDSDKNVFNTGSWNVLTPFVLDKLSSYGMHNPIKDLIDNDDAFFISNKLSDEMEEYLTKWYAGEGEKIVLTQVDTIEGQSVWKVKKVEK